LYTKKQMEENFCILPRKRENEEEKKKQSVQHCRSAAETPPSTSKILMCHSWCCTQKVVFDRQRSPHVLSKMWGFLPLVGMCMPYFLLKYILYMLKDLSALESILKYENTPKAS
jgi:hypothetical protein